MTADPGRSLRASFRNRLIGRRRARLRTLRSLGGGASGAKHRREGNNGESTNKNAGFRENCTILGHGGNRLLNALKMPIFRARFDTLMIPFSARDGSTISRGAFACAASSCIMQHASFHLATVPGARTPTASIAQMRLRGVQMRGFPTEWPEIGKGE